MFTAPVMLLPGQELRKFKVSRPKTEESARGRDVITGYDQLGTIRAILARAKPEEKERWRQIGHPITHIISMPGSPSFDIKSSDYLQLSKRRFYIQALPYDVGDLGHWTLFYCDERTDVV